MKPMLSGKMLPDGSVEIDGKKFAPIKVERKTKTAIVRVNGEWRKVKLSAETAPRERSKPHRSHEQRNEEEFQKASEYAHLMEKGEFAKATDLWVELAYGAQLHPIYKEKPLPDWEKRILERAGMLSPEVEE